jgi:hypothetical protein
MRTEREDGKLCLTSSMLTEFWQRSRASQRRILSEVGQIELAIERENPRRELPRFLRDSPNKLAKILILGAAIIILIGVDWFRLRTP